MKNGWSRYFCSNKCMEKSPVWPSNPLPFKPQGNWNPICQEYSRFPLYCLNQANFLIPLISHQLHHEPLDWKIKNNRKCNVHSSNEYFTATQRNDILRMIRVDKITSYKVFLTKPITKLIILENIKIIDSPS